MKVRILLVRMPIHGQRMGAPLTETNVLLVRAGAGKGKESKCEGDADSLR